MTRAEIKRALKVQREWLREAKKKKDEKKQQMLEEIIERNTLMLAKCK